MISLSLLKNVMILFLLSKASSNEESGSEAELIQYFNTSNPSIVLDTNLEREKFNTSNPSIVVDTSLERENYKDKIKYSLIIFQYLLDETKERRKSKEDKIALLSIEERDMEEIKATREIYDRIKDNCTGFIQKLHNVSPSADVEELKQLVEESIALINQISKDRKNLCVKDLTLGSS